MAVHFFKEPDKRIIPPTDGKVKTSIYKTATFIVKQGSGEGDYYFSFKHVKAKSKFKCT